MMYCRFRSSVVKALNRKFSSSQPYHIPVMVNECCSLLDIQVGGVYVDCTLGGGGHSRAILERGGKVIGLDQDGEALQQCKNNLLPFIQSKQLEVHHANFCQLGEVLAASEMLRVQESCSPSSLNGKSHDSVKNALKVHGIFLDLGVSSHQIDDPTRGFSFSQDGPLDMRMNRPGEQESSLISNTTTATASMSSLVYGLSPSSEYSAVSLINQCDANTLANILYEFGDEPKSRQLARDITRARPIHTTGELHNIIANNTPWKYRQQTLARCFQALRIVVNNEMGVLDTLLRSVHTHLLPGVGRLVVLSYHSLEDRRIKMLFKNSPLVHSDQRTLHTPHNKRHNPWVNLNKKVVTATAEEIVNNSRSRSAKLRAAAFAPKEVD